VKVTVLPSASGILFTFEDGRKIGVLNVSSQTADAVSFNPARKIASPEEFAVNARVRVASVLAFAQWWSVPIHLQRESTDSPRDYFAPESLTYRQATAIILCALALHFGTDVNEALRRANRLADLYPIFPADVPLSDAVEVAKSNL